MPEITQAINNAPFDNYKPKTIVESATEFLRESIITGALKPGEKINNKEIIDRLGISNIPFREAIRSLEKEGLIFSRPGRGNWVAETSRKDFEETFEMREMLELFAVSLIRRRKEAGVDINKEIESIDIDDEAAYLRAESCMSFHYHLIQLADNSKLLALYNMLSNNIRRYQIMSYTIRDEDESCVHAHSDILTMLKDADYTRVKQHIRNHMNELKSKLLKRILFSE